LGAITAFCVRIGNNPQDDAALSTFPVTNCSSCGKKLTTLRQFLTCRLLDWIFVGELNRFDRGLKWLLS
jgi:hypothetical protein